MKRPLFPILLTSLLVSACSGGSSSGSTTAPPADDQFDASAFTYADPYPTDFHPLGEATFSAYQLDEGMAYFNRKNLDGSLGGASFQLRDDIHAGSPQIGIGTGQMAANGFLPQDACTGDVDGDGRLEAIYVGLAQTQNNHTAIHVSQPDQFGQAVGYDNIDTEQHDYNGWWTGVRGVHCVAGDVDGDGQDELIITESRTDEMRLRIVRLSYDGGLPVFSDLFTETYAGGFGRVAVGQFDDDGPLEILVGYGTFGLQGNMKVHLRDDLVAGAGVLREITNVTAQSLELIIGEFDGDRYDEIGVAHQDWVGVHGGGVFSGVQYNEFATKISAWDWTPGGVLTHLRSTTLEGTVAGFDEPNWEWDAIGERRRERFLAADLNEDGIDEIAFLHVVLTDAQTGTFGAIGYSWNVFIRTWDPVLGGISGAFLHQATTPSWGIGTVDPFRGADIAVLDDDGEGNDNILVTIASDEGSPGTYARQILLFNATTFFNVGYLGNIGKEDVPIMAGGDFDGEGLRLRYTGNKYQHLPDPIPMVLLAAPPTKSGTDQNTLATGSSYTVSDSLTEAYSVSSGVSWSVSHGFGASDITGNFEASAKSTITGSVEKSTGNSSTLTTSKTFSGAYDADSIVFEGTLHTMYEYEVVEAENAALVGTVLSINVPVSTKVFKWTTDFYNNNVDAKDQIPADVFTHAIGDPTTYPTEASLKSLLKANGGAYDGWEGTDTTLGQGGGSVGIGLSMGSVLTQGETHKYGVEYGVEFKVGGPTYGASFGISNSNMYEISVGHTTDYDGVIGDMGTSDWTNWHYDVGMVVYTRADVDKKPFQVLQYWTETFGAGY